MLPRFYYPEILKGNNQISNKTHVHHICKVLRLKRNDYIQLFDGAGNHAKAKIIEAKKQIIEYFAFHESLKNRHFHVAPIYVCL